MKGEKAQFGYPNSQESKERSIAVRSSPSNTSPSLPRLPKQSLVKALEDNGVGRPPRTPRSSTRFGPRLCDAARAPVHADRNRIAVNDLLVEHFPKIVNLDFTARMEGDLDKVADGSENGSSCCAAFTARLRTN